MRFFRSRFKALLENQTNNTLALSHLISLGFKSMSVQSDALRNAVAASTATQEKLIATLQTQSGVLKDIRQQLKDALANAAGVDPDLEAAATDVEKQLGDEETRGEAALAALVDPPLGDPAAGGTADPGAGAAPAAGDAPQS